MAVVCFDLVCKFYSVYRITCVMCLCKCSSVIHWCFWFFQYSCLDQAVFCQELYGQSVCMGAQVMELLVRHVRLQRATEQRASLLAQEVAKLKHQLKVVELQPAF